MSLIDEATSGAEALIDGAGDVALTFAGDVAYQSAEIVGDVAERAFDVAADTAEEAVEAVKRVGLRRLLAVVVVLAILAVVAKLVRGSTSPAEPVNTTFTPQPDSDASSSDVVDLSAQ